MTKEELLAEAARRYPIGTEYIGLRDKDKPQVAVCKPISYTPDAPVHICDIGVGYDYVYRGGKWAEITKSVVPETNNYPIYL